MTALCVAAGAALLRLAWPDFTLAWTHSIERTEWQEDYVVSEAGLHLRLARVRGTGAGMEPGPDARLVNGWYVWFPNRTVPQLVVARSGAVDGYRLCRGGHCLSLDDLLGPSGPPATLEPCPPG
jgi:hypothetical protein